MWGKGNVSIHGRYYSLIIDGENSENIVVDDEGLAITDTEATPISSLKKKNIKTLSFYSCNAGLLDAIDCKMVKKVQDSNNDFTITQNVAMEFYDLGGIDEITAYDGSVGFSVHKPRLSYTQSTTFSDIIDLQPVSYVKVRRYDGKVSDYKQYLMRPKENGIYFNKMGICPNGEVRYVSSSQKAIYNYDYKHVSKYIIDLTKHQNKTSFLLNGHKHPTCLKRQVM